MHADTAALGRIVRAERGTVAVLLELLRAEQDALLKGDSDRLAELVESKGARLADLHELSGQRLELLRAHGRAPDRASIEAWIRGHSSAQPGLLEDWRQLLRTLRIANEVNHINGELLAARLRMTQQALSVMFSAARASGTYDAGGSAVTLHGPRQLAVA